MTHALADFLRTRMDERGLRNRDVEQLSGLSRQLVSKYVSDTRDKLTRLPEKTTLEGLARAVGVSTEFLLSKAVEALGLGYTAGDFVNDLASATDAELFEELARRTFQSTLDRSALEEVVAESPDGDRLLEAAARRANEIVHFGTGSGKTDVMWLAFRRLYETGKGRPRIGSYQSGTQIRPVEDVDIAARRGVRKRSITDRAQDTAGEENQDNGGVDPA